MDDMVSGKGEGYMVDIPPAKVVMCIDASCSVARYGDFVLAVVIHCHHNGKNVHYPPFLLVSFSSRVPHRES